jgi:undecaprenyl-diphosphatase
VDLWQIIVLAVIQGLTEFLPISSSAHLLLPQEILGWQDQGLAFDVAVHVGSLAAVMFYFRRDIGAMVVAWFRQLHTGQASPDSRLAWAVIVATLPAGICGLLLDNWIEANLRSVAVIACTTIVFALLLAWADRNAPGGRQTVTLPMALLVGAAQALALIPGTSRSGITMTAGLLLGLSREQASRFSFLLAIPLILAAGSLKGLELLRQGADAPWGFIVIGALLSALTAYLCIAWFLRLVERIGFMPFVIYRLLLGLVLIGLMVSG